MVRSIGHGALGLERLGLEVNPSTPAPAGRPETASLTTVNRLAMLRMEFLDVP